jgi:ABC-type multidrug transport system fused ATPase/permease subunit
MKTNSERARRSNFKQKMHSSKNQKLIQSSVVVDTVDRTVAKKHDMDGARDAASDAAKRVAQQTMDAAVSALALCPRTLILLDAFHPVGSHERAEFISRLMALAALHYAQHMASHRAWRSSARAWTKMMDGDSRGTLGAIAGACAWAGFGAEPLRLSRRTYRALLGRELATRIGNDAIERVMDEKALSSSSSSSSVMNPANGRATATDPLAASVAAPTFARTALDAAANGVEAFVDLIYHGHCLFQSNPWTAPALVGCAVYGQIMSSSRMFDDDEAKKEAHRAETASNRLRELLMHASANGEAIALANGCKVEAEEAMATLEAGQEFVYRRQVLNARSRFPADTYAAVANFLPMVAILPKLARGEPVSAWNVQIAMTAFNGIRSALGILAENITTLRTAEMHATHVSNLYESLDALQWQGGEGGAMGALTTSTPEDDMSLVEVEGLVLTGHDGMAVIRNLDLVLCRGDSLAIVGPPQCGKTMLVKALIGLWTRGSGSARVVDRRSICVLSRRPYVPMGTLLDVCTYPLPASDVGSETRSVISKVMVDLGLSKYIEYLDTISPWTDLMSLSEQQRFAVCRAVVSKAELCILDDATSAMDPKDRASAYRVLKEHVGGILSLGDEISLPRLHERTIRIHANGSWSDFTQAETAPPVESRREEQVLQPRSAMEQQRPADDSEPQSFSPLQMDASRRENQFLRRQKKNVARALGVKPEKLGVVPTPTKTEKKSPRSSPATRSLSFDPLA